MISVLVGRLSPLGEAAFIFGAAHTLLPIVYPDAIVESPYPLGLHKLVVFGMGVGTMLTLMYPNKLLTGALVVSYVGSAYLELTGKVRWNVSDDRGLRLALAVGDVLTAAALLT